jgi:hypothetical protein
MEYAGLPEVKLPVPPGWEDRSQLIIVSDSHSDVFRANIVVVSEPQGERNMEEFVDDHIGTLDRTFERFRLDFDQPATFGAYEGYLIDYAFTVQEREYRQRQFFTLANRTIFTFTYSDTADGFPASVGVLEQVVSKAKILGVGNGGYVFNGSRVAAG